MPSTSGRARVAAATAASVLGAFGIPALVATPAGTATAAPALATGTPAPVSVNGLQQVQTTALQTTSNSNLGAVTFVNNDVAGSATADFVVSKGGAMVGTLPLAVGTFTRPQLLPAGTYSVAVTESGATTTGSLTVTQGKATSEVLYDSTAPAPTSPTTTTPPTTAASTTSTTAPAATAPTSSTALASFADAVPATPAGRTTLSVRNLSPTAGAVDVFVNGTKVASNLAVGASVDTNVAPGTQNVVVVPTGQQPTSGTPLFTGNFTSQPASYVPLYVVNDASQAQGVGADTTAFLQGYQFVASDGGVFNFGSFPFLGSTGDITLNQPMVGGAEATTGNGYWLVASDGGIFTFGDVPFLGSLGDLRLNSPIVGMAATVGPNGKPGYLLVAADGGVFAFNASFFGSLGGQHIDSKVVGIAADPVTGSYTIAESNGEWFTFGPGHENNPVHGKVAATLNKPIVGVADTPDGGGSWLVATDGGVFTIGNAPFLGSTGNITLNQPIESIDPTFDGLGYSLVAGDGGVFNYGDSRFFGSTGNIVLNQPIVGAINNS